MRRSLMSAASRFASSKRGARRTNRAVSRTVVLVSRRVSTGIRSSNVIFGFLGPKKQDGEPACRLPLSKPFGPTGSTGAPADLDVVHRLFGRGLHRYDRDVGAALGFGTIRNATVD